MQVRVLENTKGTPDGYIVSEFAEGKKYDLPENLAYQLISSGKAESLEFTDHLRPSGSALDCSAAKLLGEYIADAHTNHRNDYGYTKYLQWVQQRVIEGRHLLRFASWLEGQHKEFNAKLGE